MPPITEYNETQADNSGKDAKEQEELKQKAIQYLVKLHNIDPKEAEVRLHRTGSMTPPGDQVTQYPVTPDGGAGATRTTQMAPPDVIENLSTKYRINTDQAKDLYQRMLSTPSKPWEQRNAGVTMATPEIKAQQALQLYKAYMASGPSTQQVVTGPTSPISKNMAPPPPPGWPTAPSKLNQQYYMGKLIPD